MWGGVKGFGKTGFRISPFWASCGGFFLKVLQGLSQQDWAAKGRLIFLPVPCMAWHESVCNVSWCMDVIAENPAREPRAVLSTGCHPLLNTKCTRVLAIPSQTSLIPSRMEGAQTFWCSVCKELTIQGCCVPPEILKMQSWLCQASCPAILFTCLLFREHSF